ncbi:protein ACCUMULATION AND REPLICATION OF CHLOROPLASTS 3, chloroplastic isoform X2 [Spinacia oleracea]|uniref:Protein ACCUMULATION AND REPLICATION OF CHLOROPLASTS 3, chloroplastic isoform X2 n=1 Tax=Spinacia oleracea TaxID=3562 RepID=A0A9R0K353_SPIOL|nr:protein ACCUMULATION AND REPLICATION OF CHLOROPLASTS 3, chloroplastic isoform X2 [Spinacia oleracea]
MTMEMAYFSILSPPIYREASLYSLKPSNHQFNCSSSTFHHHIRFLKSSAKFKRESFHISYYSSPSLQNRCNSDAIDSTSDIWTDSQFVEVIGIGSRVDSILDFCLSSSSTSSSLRFWNVIRSESSRGQLRQRILEKDDCQNIAEAPLNQQLNSKAVVLVASAGYGDDYVTATDILRTIRSSGGLVVAVIVKPFSFEGQRRQDEVTTLVNRLRDCVNFCIDIDIDALLKMDMVTLDEALKTAYQAVLSATSAVSILVSDTYKKHIHSLHDSVTQITIGEVVKVLESYKEGRVGYGVGNSAKASIVQAVYDCPFLSIELKDLDGVVICILSSSSAIADNDACTLFGTFREATDCTKEVIISTVQNPDMKPNMISTTIITVCDSERKSLQNSSILSRLADSIPFVFSFLRRHDKESGKPENVDARENSFPPMLANFMNEMFLDENCSEMEFEDDESETDTVEYVDSVGHSSKYIEQIDQAQTFGRKLFINRNLRPDFRISQEGHEEELNVSVADLLDENPRIYQLPVGVRFSDDLNDSTDKSNIRSPEEINDVDIQMQASPVPSVPPLNGIADVGFDAVTDFWNSASVFLKRKKPNNSKKQGVLSTRAASMLESERETKTKWSPVMEIRYRGGVYKGRCQGGLPEGRGRLTFLDGTAYDGVWRYGKRSGIGSLFFKNGDVFHGSWRDDLLHGKGWLYFHTGERWFANFWKGRANGEGRFYSTSGEVLFGYFQDGWRHGQFLCVKVDGTRFVEIWNDGVLMSSDELDT